MRENHLVHSKDNKFENVQLPPHSQGSIGMSDILKLVQNASSPLGEFLAFRRIILSAPESTKDDLLGQLPSPAWFKYLQSKIPQESPWNPYVQYYLDQWNFLHGNRNTTPERPKKIYRPCTIKPLFNDEILNIISLSEEQHTLKGLIESVDDRFISTNFASGMYKQVCFKKLRKCIKERETKLENDPGYDSINRAIDSWLLSAMYPEKELVNLGKLLEIDHSAHREIILKLTQDVIRWRYFPENLGAQYTRGLRHTITIKDIEPVFTEPVSPEQYELIGLFPGGFYYSWLRGNVAEALKALRDTLKNDQERSRYENQGLATPIKFALSQGECELAWQLSLLTDILPENSTYISNSEHLPLWTARAPFIKNYRVNQENVAWPTNIPKMLFSHFVEALIGGKHTRARLFLDTLALLPLPEKLCLGLEKLLQAAEQNDNQSMTFNSDECSPFTTWFTTYGYQMAPIASGWLALHLMRARMTHFAPNNSLSNEQAAGFSSLLREVATGVEAATGRSILDRKDLGVFVFASFLASKGLKNEAYKLLEELNSEGLPIFAEKLGDKDKSEWLLKIDEAVNLLEKLP